jgi:hypothetical protein
MVEERHLGWLWGFFKFLVLLLFGFCVSTIEWRNAFWQGGSWVEKSREIFISFGIIVIHATFS